MKGQKIQKIVTRSGCNGKLPDGQACSHVDCTHVCNILCMDNCGHGRPAPGTGPLVLIKRARALVNVINTGTHRAQLQRIAGHFSFKYVAPQLDGETRVSGVAVMFRSLLVLRLLLHEYAIAKPELLRTAMLTDVEWAQLAELLAIVEKVEDFNTMVQTANTCIGPMGLMLRVWLAKQVRGKFCVVQWRRPVKAGVGLRRLPSREVAMENLEFPESRHTARRLLFQVRKYLGADSVTDADLLAMVFGPHTKGFLWRSDWCADASWLFGDMKAMRRRAKRLMREEITALHTTLHPPGDEELSASSRRSSTSQDIVDSSDDEGSDGNTAALGPLFDLGDALRRLERFRKHDFSSVVAEALEAAGVPGDVNDVKALIRLPVAGIICTQKFMKAWPLCSLRAQTWAPYGVASSFQESLFSRAKMVLAYQRLRMGDVIFEMTTCLAATTVFQRGKRRQEKAMLKAKARAAEELKTPSPSASASMSATALKVVRPAEASLAELTQRLARRGATRRSLRGGSNAEASGLHTPRRSASMQSAPRKTSPLKSRDKKIWPTF